MPGCLRCRRFCLQEIACSFKAHFPFESPFQVCPLSSGGAHGREMRDPCAEVFCVQETKRPSWAARFRRPSTFLQPPVSRIGRYSSSNQTAFSRSQSLQEEGMFKILEKEHFAPHVNRFVIGVPQVTKDRSRGQFVIIRVGRVWRTQDQFCPAGETPQHLP